MPIIPPAQGYLFTASAGAGTPGNEHSISVPARNRWRLHSIALSLTTDANAANRRVHIIIRRAPSDYLIYPTNTDQTAGLSWAYYFAPHLGNLQTALGTVLTFGIGPPWVLAAGDTILTQTTNIQAGDQYTALIVKGESWIEP